MRQRQLQSGFTLVETMIAMAILMAAIYAGMTLLDIQRSSGKTRETQTMYRYLAIQTASIVTGYPEKFPALAFSTAWDDSRDIVIYFACYDKAGNLTPNDLGKREFTFHQMARDDLDSRRSSERCPSLPLSTPRYEVRFWYKNPVTREVTIEILDLTILRSRNSKAAPKQRFTIFR